ncbi:MAG: amino acid permease [Verrucomicrobia bacterium]|nr:amino acid permease [Verrucomicrobiota bacterium]
MKNLFRLKSLEQLLRDAEHPERRLKRSLGPLQLTFLGIGAIVGAGIFSTVGTAVAGGPDYLGAGPALVVSFVLVAIACGFAALCYAELTAMVPVSGSAYTYAYATLGQLVAWIIGWDLILEYAVGNVAVAISWSGYFQQLLRGLGVDFPLWLGIDYRSAAQAARDVAAAANGVSPDAVTIHAAQAWADAPRLFLVPLVFNLPAFVITMLVTWVLVLGIRESAGFNTVMVAVKLAFVLFFLVVGAFYVKPENWTPFAPNGFAGISSAAAVIFFAYIGFDAISTAAEETRDPQRNLPIGILASLVICTLIYVAVAVVLTGLMPWRQLGTAEPLATAFAARGLNWTAGVMSFGAVLATTSVLLVFQLGQVRIFFSMARDGLLPPWAARVHPRYRTPHVNTIIAGVAVGVVAGCTNIKEVVELCNIGTLFAFVIVAVSILILRRTHPDWPRPFRVPLFPWVPLAAILTSGYLMLELPALTWKWFVGWLVVGLGLYFCYGHWRAGKESTVQSSQFKAPNPPSS